MKKGNWNSDKTKGFIIGAAAAIVLMLIIGQAVFELSGFNSVAKPDSLAAYKKVHQISTLIERDYIGEIDEEKLADYMYLGLASGLEDKYSTYYTKEEFDALMRAQNGMYLGIGIVIVQDEDGSFAIVSIAAESPAEQAGLAVDDIILSVDGTSTEGKTLSEVVELIRSEGEKTFEITVYRESSDKTLQVEVHLEELESQSVAYEMLEDNIGYIRIESFTGVVPKQFGEARQELEESGAEALIIDLMGNPGGLVDSALSTLQSFMPEGLLYYVEDAKERKDYSSEGGDPISIPVAVLVDSGSASASEIFTGAVKDNDVGVIVGEKTYGKGIIQNTYTLSDGSALRITAAHYYTPNGNDIHGVGIEPDIVVTEPSKGTNALDAAREYLLSELEKQ